ncbi:MAG TPA: monovalent cation/H+ antiporter complex subunit F [Jiangellaceae bacterium]|nr:monovalent cation/H+ antiporter complex subunit F [Jiangellaceae bacterium]
MTVILWICAAAFGSAAALAVWRMNQGPRMLDRMIAVDVLIAAVVGGLGLEAAVNRHATTLPILLVLSLVGFVGSVSVARFAAGESRPPMPGSAEEEPS